ncbi:MAG TPA: selenocysteine-specific translation elongation factor [Anaerolineae bacterium]|nr:selenocysteine-specific translation elongation factor [Anaerolineae bacterium]
MRVIGTAGHVDHGKSTLIAALTGTHPDRLKEEQAREMTIDLGFGWMTLPNGEDVGIVDVPGHRDFIENMLSGIGAIDAVLLVIAADEGVMPQTKEHLAIIDLLQIPVGLIILSKTDLASDEGWLDLVENEIRATTASTILNDSPIVRVSAKNKTGLDSLILSLQSILEECSPRIDLGRPRLPVDRVFTMSGFGTVVTGTLSDGHFSIGDEVELLPSGITGRIRGLQTHKKKEDKAVPGSRTAVNISGVSTEQIQRGNIVSHPNQYQITRRLDARLRVLNDISTSIKHGHEIKFFVGASETIGIVRILGREEIGAGEDGWVQLELRDPIVAVRGDRYIIRRPSPGETLGGGVIVDNNPKGRHKRFDEKIIKSLEALLQGSPADILFEAALTKNIASVKDIVNHSRLEKAVAESALEELLSNGRLVILENGSPTITSEAFAIAISHWRVLNTTIMNVIESYHKAFPLRRGIPREELKSRLKLSPRMFNAIMTKLKNEQVVEERSAAIAKARYEVIFNEVEQANVDALMRVFEQNPFGPPGIKECYSEAGEEVVNALIAREKLISVSADVVFRKQDYDLMVVEVRNFLEKNRSITIKS